MQTLDESVLDAVRQSEPTAQLDSGPRDDGQVLEELLADFHRHELVRIPGLYQSLANLVRSATPGSSEAPDSFKLLIPQRTSNSDVPADDTERQVWDQIKIIEEQYASEAQKVEQVCEDVGQRMKRFSSPNGAPAMSRRRRRTFTKRPSAPSSNPYVPSFVIGIRSTFSTATSTCQSFPLRFPTQPSLRQLRPLSMLRGAL